MEGHTPLILLLYAAPLSFWAALGDLRHMKITNRLNLILAGGFVVLGPLAMPFDDYLWQLLVGVIALVLGFILNAIGAVGGGDAKFTAAAAPYILPQHMFFCLQLLAVLGIAGLLIHRFARNREAIVNLAPHWESWKQRRHFPYGTALGTTLIVYLTMTTFFSGQLP